MATQLIPVPEFDWTDDFSWLRMVTCVNHPSAIYLTKNPMHRTLHFIKPADGMTGMCDCDNSELRVVVDGVTGLSINDPRILPITNDHECSEDCAIQFYYEEL